MSAEPGLGRQESEVKSTNASTAVPAFLDFSLPYRYLVFTATRLGSHGNHDTLMPQTVYPTSDGHGIVAQATSPRARRATTASDLQAESS